MTDNNSPTNTSDKQIEPPDRIWTVGGKDGHFFTKKGNFAQVEYARVNRCYFCSCGGALTAEEYIQHYFQKGHDRRLGVRK